MINNNGKKKVFSPHFISFMNVTHVTILTNINFTSGHVFFGTVVFLQVQILFIKILIGIEELNRNRNKFNIIYIMTNPLTESWYVISIHT